MCVNTHSHEGWEVQGFETLSVFRALEQEGKKTAVGYAGHLTLMSNICYSKTSGELQAVFWPPTVLVLAKNLKGGAWGCVFSQEGPRIIFVCSIRPGAHFDQIKWFQET